ncbi:hypothetical protein NSA56_11360 [Oceanobacillus caeni]|uniref:hypothetical protein n=1 Tax=Bacillaceae TaxID=186817 RepID=UPI00214A1568|nr:MULTISPECIES: hypothetical protein [Bacillaceae]MCR1834993.1 hypothetical protein [Oceanobacillus caeni]MED4852254.1 hypothetical protein [Caldifermentibacillus hisashii]
MVNRHRENWSNMGASKYEFEPDKLDKDIKTKQERYNRKKDTIKAMVEGMMKSDPVGQEETFQMFVEVLKEWRERND